MKLPLDRRPVVVAIAGPNGAGKTTFFHAHLRRAGLRFLNADVIARDLEIHPYAAAKVTERLREQLLEQRESFVFETVFSDPVGDKVDFLCRAVAEGYTAVLCFIRLSGPDLSEERVAMRISQGGHDVPTEKLLARFPRTMANLEKAIPRLPFVYVFDNTDLAHPFRMVARYEDGQLIGIPKAKARRKPLG